MSRLDGMAVVKTNRALPAATMMLMLLGGWHGLLCCPMIKFTYVNAAPALQLYSNCNVILCKTNSSLQSFLAAFEGFYLRKELFTRDVRGGAFSSGAGRGEDKNPWGGAKMKISGARRKSA